MYVATGGPDVKWGSTDFKWGGPGTTAPRLATALDCVCEGWTVLTR